MSTFHSGFAGHIEDFIRYRKASGIWNTTYEKNLLLFDHYCSNTFPELVLNLQHAEEYLRKQHKPPQQNPLT